ncbi:hypothetical protein ABMY47_18225 [Pseudoalteromonas sp. BZP1]|uniref:hypothetical protein n=1 Tax=unclassified Pseudoalteromonas TaxID=194690 RepID=UPI0032C49870|tara:strand:- start:2861 stop:3409 length:549 start_codon:yes stop_codon:yes gene_type:complete
MEQEISKEVIYLIGSSIIGTVSLITVTITSLVTFKVSNKNNLALLKKELRSKRIDNLKETLTSFNEYYSKARLACGCVITIKSMQDRALIEMFEKTREESTNCFFMTMNLIELNCDLNTLDTFLKIDKQLEETARMISNLKEEEVNNEISEKAKSNLVNMHQKAIEIKKAIRNEYQELMGNK